MMVMVVRTTKGGDIFDIAWELAHKGLYIKDIEGYEGQYQISSEGRVANKRTGKVLKTFVCGSGYSEIIQVGGRGIYPEPVW